MLPILTLLQLLDIWTTHKCLSRSNTVESNPILAKLFGYIGIFKLDPQTEMITGCVIAACITVLRIVTTQPIGAKT